MDIKDLDRESLPKNITEELQKEELSNAFVRVVCAYCGYALTKPEQDTQGIDFSFSIDLDNIDGLLDDTLTINFQLKATTETSKSMFRYAKRTGNPTYTLKEDAVKTYNKFTRKKKSKNHLFYYLLLVLNERVSEWVKFDPQNLDNPNKIYFLNVSGEKPAEGESKDLIFPKENQFSPQNLKELILNAILQLKVPEQ